MKKWPEASVTNISNKAISPEFKERLELKNVRFGDPVTVRLIDFNLGKDAANPLIVVPAKTYESGDGGKFVLHEFDQHYAVLMSLDWTSNDSLGPTSDELTIQEGI